ncbi:MAG: Fe(3+) dicitrate transport protein [Porticoccaceae bacterium]|jgi:Fe(3+) dicitrate transport protein|nr:TonB-dependent receptor [SAR92 clade bacterium]MDB9977138.1 TonB-dependent receptor [Porticoccaceae bacterium]
MFKLASIPFINLALIFSFSVSFAYADHAEKSQFFEEITIVGNKDRASTVAGSAHFISDAELEVFNYADIQQILRQVPGVNLQLEDGYGLRPNIGIRGVQTERSGRIMLLEDGVPIAPAPYAASSAYYFPTAGRMYSVEVLKGPAAITEGPNTIGGAINMISTPIPEETEGKVVAEVGGNSTTRVHAAYGSTNSDGFGYLIETHQWKSDGFQSIDGSNSGTGLDIKDYTVKLGYAPVDSRHAFELKYQYAEQDSNQSYLGITDADFDRDPYRRYSVSQNDLMTAEHKQLILRHDFSIRDNLNMTTTAYNNDHARSWYKLDKLGGVGPEKIIADINKGTTASSDLALQAILLGGDSAAGDVAIKDNNRNYYSRGVSVKFDWLLDGSSASHDIEVGFRYHQDEEDRLQRSDKYTQVDQTLIVDSIGVTGGNKNNRVVQAEALAIYIKDDITFGNFIVTPGVRFEDIKLERRDWSTLPRNTTPSLKQNSVTAVLPSIGVLYNVNDNLSLLAGAYNGFGTPTTTSGVDEEQALNVELGGRYQQADLMIELIAFTSDYENLVGECTASSSTSDCDIGDQFNGGQATVRGLEFQLTNSFQLTDSTTMPVSIAYTYTDAEFDSTFDGEFFGDVSKGDPIPYIPKTQVALALGLENGPYRVNANLNYVDAVCVKASCVDFEKTDDSTVLDLVGNYQVNDNLGVYLRLENITDEADIIARQPKGARPNKARSATIGMRLVF